MTVLKLNLACTCRSVWTNLLLLLAIRASYTIIVQLEIRLLFGRWNAFRVGISLMLNSLSPRTYKKSKMKFIKLTTWVLWRVHEKLIALSKIVWVTHLGRLRYFLIVWQVSWVIHVQASLILLTWSVEVTEIHVSWRIKDVLTLVGHAGVYLLLADV